MKILCVLMSLLLAFTFVACQNTNSTESNQSSNVAADADQTSPLDVLPKEDFDGYSFVVVYRDAYDSFTDLSYDKESQDVLEVAKYERALEVMDYYGFELTTAILEGDGAGNSALSSIVAGDTAYDVIMPHSHIAWNTYIADGYALEWTKNMIYNNLDAEWWDQNAKKCLSIGGNIYTMLGDSSWFLLGSSVGLLFNKTVFDDNKIAYPYEDVKNNTWTFEKFKQIAIATSKDLNGDSVMDLENDRYGYTTGLYMGPMGFLWTSGSKMVEKDANDMPYIAINNERTIDLYDSFFDMMSNDGFHIYNDRDSFSTLFHEEFAAGKVAMTDTMISNISQLREMENFGLLPYPMYDETVGEYHSTADAGIHSPIIPYNTKDAARTSMIWEALTIMGHEKVVPAFYEVTLKIKYTDDDADKDMLDLIRATRTFDFGYYTDSVDQVGLVGTRLFLYGQDFVSFYKTVESAAEMALQNFVENLDYLYN